MLAIMDKKDNLMDDFPQGGKCKLSDTTSAY